MKQLSIALFNQALASTAFWNAIGGRFYNRVAPAGTVFPYAVFDPGPGDTDESTWTEVIENLEPTISLFSATPEDTTEIEDLFELLLPAFDGCTLTISGHTFLHMYRTGQTLFEDEIENPNGTGSVWHYAVMFNLKFER